MGNVNLISVSDTGDFAGVNFKTKDEVVKLILHVLSRLTKHEYSSDYVTRITQHIFREDPSATMSIFHEEEKWGLESVIKHDVDFTGLNLSIVLNDDSGDMPVHVCRGDDIEGFKSFEFSAEGLKSAVKALG